MIILTRIPRHIIPIHLSLSDHISSLSGIINTNVTVIIKAPRKGKATAEMIEEINAIAAIWFGLLYFIILLKIVYLEYSTGDSFSDSYSFFPSKSNIF